MSSKNILRLKQLDVSPPVAARVPYKAQHHERTLEDAFHWLKDQAYPEVEDKKIIGYLNQENEYYQTFLRPNQQLADKIFEEFKGRTDEQETSVPYIDNGYEYRWFFRSGEEYRTRSRINLETGEDAVFLDEAKLAKEHEYFVIGDWEISSDNRYLAYSVDTSGDERYQARIIDLESGSYLDDVLNDIQGSIEFNADGKQLMYALLEKNRWHSKYIKAHTIGTLQDDDVTVYHESDDGFFISFNKTSSKEFIVISSGQGEINETYILPSDFSGDLTLVVHRTEGFQHKIDHANG